MSMTQRSREQTNISVFRTVNVTGSRAAAFYLGSPPPALFSTCGPGSCLSPTIPDIASSLQMTTLHTLVLSLEWRAHSRNGVGL